MASASSTGAPPPARRPNVVFVLTDDQGYGDIGYTGNPIIQTPVLDALAADSIRFDRFHVSPTCAPTRSALMTSRHEFHNRISHTILGRSILREDAFMLPEMLRDCGYRTGLFGKWHLGDNYPCRPQDRGFEESLHHGGGGITQTPDYWGNQYFSPHLAHNGTWEPSEGYCTDVFFDHALAWIEQHRDEPFFCCITTNCPHRPLQVDQRYIDLYADADIDLQAKRFYGMLTNVDENMARLMDTLDRLSLRDDTLVIYMGDNGSAEAGNPQRGLYNGGMRGGKGTCYEGGTRVCCFFHHPRAFGPGRQVDALCAHVDFLPTLADLCGGALPDDLPLEGRSLAPLLTNPHTHWADRHLVTHVGRWGVDEDPEDYKLRRCSVRTRRWRWVEGRELFDLKADPGETTNVIDQHPDVAAELAEYYDRWWTAAVADAREPQRIRLGNDAENPAWLTCHDWQRSVANPDIPTQSWYGVWQQRALATVARGEAWEERHATSSYGGVGAWGVIVEQPGTYRLTLHKLPPAARDGLRRLKAGEAHVLVGPDADSAARGSAPIVEGAGEVTVTLDLPAGPAWLEGWFTGQRPDGHPLGAFFVAVERVG